MSEPHVVIMGPQGAGKGTQSRRIVDEFGVEQVTTGDALRANRDMETEHGTPREYMEAGELVPDAVVNEIVEAALAEAAGAGYVLDGYPRNRSQAEYLADIADLDAVLFVDIDDETAVERLSGRRVCEGCNANYHVEFEPPSEAGVCDDCGGDLLQRDDDTPEAIRTRLAEYHEKTEPVVEYYRAETDVPVVDIDGERPPDEVWADVRAAVGDAAE
jgi:adenylate kinase